MKYNKFKMYYMLLGIVICQQSVKELNNTNCEIDKNENLPVVIDRDTDTIHSGGKPGYVFKNDNKTELRPLLNSERVQFIETTQPAKGSKKEAKEMIIVGSEFLRDGESNTTILNFDDLPLFPVNESKTNVEIQKILFDTLRKQGICIEKDTNNVPNQKYPSRDPVSKLETDKWESIPKKSRNNFYERFNVGVENLPTKNAIDCSKHQENVNRNNKMNERGDKLRSIMQRKIFEGQIEDAVKTVSWSPERVKNPILDICNFLMWLETFENKYKQKIGSKIIDVRRIKNQLLDAYKIEKLRCSYTVSEPISTMVVRDSEPPEKKLESEKNYSFTGEPHKIPTTVSFKDIQGSLLFPKIVKKSCEKEILQNPEILINQKLNQKNAPKDLCMDKKGAIEKEIKIYDFYPENVECVLPYLSCPVNNGAHKNDDNYIDAVEIELNPENRSNDDAYKLYSKSIFDIYKRQQPILLFDKSKKEGSLRTESVVQSSQSPRIDTFRNKIPFSQVKKICDNPKNSSPFSIVKPTFKSEFCVLSPEIPIIKSPQKIEAEKSQNCKSIDLFHKQVPLDCKTSPYQAATSMKFCKTPVCPISNIKNLIKRVPILVKKSNSKKLTQTSLPTQKKCAITQNFNICQQKLPVQPNRELRNPTKDASKDIQPQVAKETTSEGVENHGMILDKGINFIKAPLSSTNNVVDSLKALKIKTRTIYENKVDCLSAPLLNQNIEAGPPKERYTTQTINVIPVVNVQKMNVPFIAKQVETSNIIQKIEQHPVGGQYNNVSGFINQNIYAKPVNANTVFVESVASKPQIQNHKLNSPEALDKIVADAEIHDGIPLLPGQPAEYRLEPKLPSLNNNVVLNTVPQKTPLKIICPIKDTQSCDAFLKINTDSKKGPSVCENIASGSYQVSLPVKKVNEIGFSQQNSVKNNVCVKLEEVKPQAFSASIKNLKNSGTILPGPNILNGCCLESLNDICYTHSLYETTFTPFHVTITTEYPSISFITITSSLTVYPDSSTITLFEENSRELGSEIHDPKCSVLNDYSTEKSSKCRMADRSKDFDKKLPNKNFDEGTDNIVENRGEYIFHKNRRGSNVEDLLKNEYHMIDSNVIFDIEKSFNEVNGRDNISGNNCLFNGQKADDQAIEEANDYMRKKSLKSENIYTNHSKRDKNGSVRSSDRDGHSDTNNPKKNHDFVNAKKKAHRDFLSNHKMEIDRGVKKSNSSVHKNFEKDFEERKKRISANTQSKEEARSKKTHVLDFIGYKVPGESTFQDFSNLPRKNIMSEDSTFAVNDPSIKYQMSDSPGPEDDSNFGKESDSQKEAIKRSSKRRNNSINGMKDIFAREIDPEEDYDGVNMRFDDHINETGNRKISNSVRTKNNNKRHQSEKASDQCADQFDIFHSSDHSSVQDYLKNDDKTCLNFQKKVEHQESENHFTPKTHNIGSKMLWVEPGKESNGLRSDCVANDGAIEDLELKTNRKSNDLKGEIVINDDTLEESEFGSNRESNGFTNYEGPEETRGDLNEASNFFDGNVQTIISTGGDITDKSRKGSTNIDSMNEPDYHGCQKVVQTAIEEIHHFDQIHKTKNPEYTYQDQDLHSSSKNDDQKFQHSGSHNLSHKFSQSDDLGVPGSKSLNGSQSTLIASNFLNHNDLFQEPLDIDASYAIESQCLNKDHKLKHKSAKEITNTVNNAQRRRSNGDFQSNDEFIPDYPGYRFDDDHFPSLKDLTYFGQLRDLMDDENLKINNDNEIEGNNGMVNFFPQDKNVTKHASKIKGRNGELNSLWSEHEIPKIGAKINKKAHQGTTRNVYLDDQISNGSNKSIKANNESKPNNFKSEPDVYNEKGKEIIEASLNEGGSDECITEKHYEKNSEGIDSQIANYELNRQSGSKNENIFDDKDTYHVCLEKSKNTISEKLPKSSIEKNSVKYLNQIDRNSLEKSGEETEVDGYNESSEDKDGSLNDVNIVSYLTKTTFTTITPYEEEYITEFSKIQKESDLYNHEESKTFKNFGNSNQMYDMIHLDDDFINTQGTKKRQKQADEVRNGAEKLILKVQKTPKEPKIDVDKEKFIGHEYENKNQSPQVVIYPEISEVSNSKKFYNPENISKTVSRVSIGKKKPYKHDLAVQVTLRVNDKDKSKKDALLSIEHDDTSEKNPKYAIKKGGVKNLKIKLGSLKNGNNFDGTSSNTIIIPDNTYKSHSQTDVPSSYITQPSLSDNNQIETIEKPSSRSSQNLGNLVVHPSSVLKTVNVEHKGDFCEPTVTSYKADQVNHSRQIRSDSSVTVSSEKHVNSIDNKLHHKQQKNFSDNEFSITQTISNELINCSVPNSSFQTTSLITNAHSNSRTNSQIKTTTRNQTEVITSFEEGIQSIYGISENNVHHNISMSSSKPLHIQDIQSRLAVSQNDGHNNSSQTFSTLSKPIHSSDYNLIDIDAEEFIKIKDDPNYIFTTITLPENGKLDRMDIPKIIQTNVRDNNNTECLNSMETFLDKSNISEKNPKLSSQNTNRIRSMSISYETQKSIPLIHSTISQHKDTLSVLSNGIYDSKITVSKDMNHDLNSQTYTEQKVNANQFELIQNMQNEILQIRKLLEQEIIVHRDSEKHSKKTMGSDFSSLSDNITTILPDTSSLGNSVGADFSNIHHSIASSIILTSHDELFSKNIPNLNISLDSNKKERLNVPTSGVLKTTFVSNESSVFPENDPACSLLSGVLESKAPFKITGKCTSSIVSSSMQFFEKKAEFSTIDVQNSFKNHTNDNFDICPEIRGSGLSTLSTISTLLHEYKDKSSYDSSQSPNTLYNIDNSTDKKTLSLPNHSSTTRFSQTLSTVSIDISTIDNLTRNSEDVDQISNKSDVKIFENILLNLNETMCGFNSNQSISFDDPLSSEDFYSAIVELRNEVFDLRDKIAEKSSSLSAIAIKENSSISKSPIEHSITIHDIVKTQRASSDQNDDSAISHEQKEQNAENLSVSISASINNTDLDFARNNRDYSNLGLFGLNHEDSKSFISKLKDNNHYFSKNVDLDTVGNLNDRSVYTRETLISLQENSPPFSSESTPFSAPMNYSSGYNESKMNNAKDEPDEINKTILITPLKDLIGVDSAFENDNHIKDKLYTLSILPKPYFGVKQSFETLLTSITASNSTNINSDAINDTGDACKSLVDSTSSDIHGYNDHFTTIEIENSSEESQTMSSSSRDPEKIKRDRENRGTDLFSTIERLKKRLDHLETQLVEQQNEYHSHLEKHKKENSSANNRSNTGQNIDQSTSKSLKGDGFENKILKGDTIFRDGPDFNDNTSPHDQKANQFEKRDNGVEPTNDQDLEKLHSVLMEYNKKYFDLEKKTRTQENGIETAASKNEILSKFSGHKNDIATFLNNENHSKSFEYARKNEILVHITTSVNEKNFANLSECTVNNETSDHQVLSPTFGFRESGKNNIIKHYFDIDDRKFKPATTSQINRSLLTVLGDTFDRSDKGLYTDSELDSNIPVKSEINLSRELTDLSPEMFYKLDEKSAVKPEYSQSGDLSFTPSTNHLTNNSISTNLHLNIDQSQSRYSSNPLKSIEISNITHSVDRENLLTEDTGISIDNLCPASSMYPLFYDQKSPCAVIQENIGTKKVEEIATAIYKTKLEANPENTHFDDDNLPFEKDSRDDAELMKSAEDASKLLLPPKKSTKLDKDKNERTILQRIIDKGKEFLNIKEGIDTKSLVETVITRIETTLIPISTKQNRTQITKTKTYTLFTISTTALTTTLETTKTITEKTTTTTTQTTRIPVSAVDQKKSNSGLGIGTMINDLSTPLSCSSGIGLRGSTIKNDIENSVILESHFPSPADETIPISSSVNGNIRNVSFAMSDSDLYEENDYTENISKNLEHRSIIQSTINSSEIRDLASKSTSESDKEISSLILSSKENKIYSSIQTNIHQTINNSDILCQTASNSVINEINENLSRNDVDISSSSIHTSTEIFFSQIPEYNTSSTDQKNPVSRTIQATVVSEQVNTTKKKELPSVAHQIKTVETNSILKSMEIQSQENHNESIGQDQKMAAYNILKDENALGKKMNIDISLEIECSKHQDQIFNEVEKLPEQYKTELISSLKINGLIEELLGTEYAKTTLLSTFSNQQDSDGIIKMFTKDDSLLKSLLTTIKATDSSHSSFHLDRTSTFVTIPPRQFDDEKNLIEPDSNLNEKIRKKIDFIALLNNLNKNNPGKSLNELAEIEDDKKSKIYTNKNINPYTIEKSITNSKGDILHVGSTESSEKGRRTITHVITETRIQKEKITSFVPITKTTTFTTKEPTFEHHTKTIFNTITVRKPKTNI